MKVICFDRDLTVDVNFDTEEEMVPDDGQPVPLEWVIWLAHESEHHIWATGNQHLRKEAGIPGIREARDLWEGEFHHSVKKDYPDKGWHSYKPARRDGLKIIKDVYDAKFPDESFEFHVVDDVYLKDMDHFFHWYPWKFREVVGEKGLPVEIPDETGVPSDPLQSGEVDYDYEGDLHEAYMVELRDSLS